MRSTKFPKQTCRLVAGIVIGGACILSAVVGFAEPAADQPANAATSGVADANSSGVSDAATPASAGRWIHIDPQTGRRVAPSAPAAALAADPAFGTSHQGLVERPAPGGGVMVDLKGRFRSAATATVGQDGKVAVDCVLPGTAGEEQTP